jgi:hypothetical protein
MRHHLTAETANRFAEIALGHVTREYPHKLDHVLEGPEDVLGPRALHPIFFGSFDWHSCVHGLVAAADRRLFPGLKAAPRVEALRDDAGAGQGGRGTGLSRPRYSGGLDGPMAGPGCCAPREAQRHDAMGGPSGAAGASFAERFKTYLPAAHLPVRTGTHNTAFAMILARLADANDRARPRSAPRRTLFPATGPSRLGATGRLLSPALTEAR